MPRLNTTDLLGWLVSVGINGGGPFPGAIQVTEGHQRNAANSEEAIVQLINKHVRQAAGYGFLTGLGGLITMPVMLLADLACLSAIATRMSAGIAHLRG